MPALVSTDHLGTITWLGRVCDRSAGLRALEQATMRLTFAGPEAEAHAGLTRASCSRVTAQYPRGTTIRNTRQLSILSAEELGTVAQEMGLPSLDPSLLGATMVISGLPDLTHLPPSSRLQAESGATIVVDIENLPCHLPAKLIEESMKGFGARFRAAARDRRGVTGWVECEGDVRLGDRLRLHVPAQRPWRATG